MNRLFLLALLPLAACQTIKEPQVKTVTVSVPVAVSCIGAKNDPGPPSAYADASLPKGPDAAAERVQKRLAANEQRKARLALLEPLLPACR